MTTTDRRRALGGILYGADYNPEQWPEEVWPEDVRLMREAGVTCVSLGIFSWSKLQPSEDRYDFTWLDRIIDLLHDGGIGVNLATATASIPPWLSAKYPEVLAADADGSTYWPGSRQHQAPSSPIFREHAAKLVTQLAERYASHPAVVMWHVGNEYGCHLSLDYSDAARDAFRGWLEKRYGTIDKLNRAWGTSFWSQRYGSFGEVFPPRKAPYSHNPSMTLDFQRFSSDMLLECYLAEREILLAAGATQPITTNFMGPHKPTNYHQWAEHMDVIADDLYPDPASPTRVADAALNRDLMRSLKPGTPWILMEQATNAVNWRPSNPSKLPGQLAAESAQSVARGADGIMFFQWRQSKAGSEKFHAAMVPHAGLETRAWRETVELGATLAGLGELPPPGRDARVALVLDWENWWAIEQSDHPTTFDHLEALRVWYRELHRRGIMVDIIPPERVDEHYQLVLAPQLYLLRESGAAALKDFVEQGGTLLVGAFSDIVDEFDHFRDGGFYTQLGDLLGIRFEDFTVLSLSPGPGVTSVGFDGAVAGNGSILAESVDATTAEILSRFADGPAAGRPALTQRDTGRGSAFWFVSIPDEEAVRSVVEHVVAAADVAPVVADLPQDVEAARRGSMVTVINHGYVPASLSIQGTDLLTGEILTEFTLDAQEFRFINMDKNN